MKSKTSTNEVKQQHLLIWVILNIIICFNTSLSGLEEHGCDICRLKHEREWESYEKHNWSKLSQYSEIIEGTNTFVVLNMLQTTL